MLTTISGIFDVDQLIVDFIGTIISGTSIMDFWGASLHFQS